MQSCLLPPPPPPPHTPLDFLKLDHPNRGRFHESAIFCARELPLEDLRRKSPKLTASKLVINLEPSKSRDFVFTRPRLISSYFLASSLWLSPPLCRPTYTVTITPFLSRFLSNLAKVIDTLVGGGVIILWSKHTRQEVGQRWFYPIESWILPPNRLDFSLN